jgi:hypothetical protein
MRVLKLTLGKIIFLQIFLHFLFFSVKCPRGFTLRPDECGSEGWTIRLHVWMRGACCMLCGNERLDELVIRQDRDPTRFKHRFLP